MIKRDSLYEPTQKVFKRVPVKIWQIVYHRDKHRLDVRLFNLRSYTRLVGSYGPQQEFITPQCPQQNGSVERGIGTLPPSKRGVVEISGKLALSLLRTFAVARGIDCSSLASTVAPKPAAKAAGTLVDVVSTPGQFKIS